MKKTQELLDRSRKFAALSRARPKTELRLGSSPPFVTGPAAGLCPPSIHGAHGPQAHGRLRLWRCALRTAILIVWAIAASAVSAHAHSRLICNDAGHCSFAGYVRPHVARRAHHRGRRHARRVYDANGNRGLVISRKTGARAYVSPRYRAEFQAYVNDLEAHGARVKFMGGYRRGHCSPRHMHPCGKALDVCQLSRGRVDPSCHLPGRSRIAAIANRHGLFEGGEWCHSDYGHAQAGVSAPACGSTLMARRRHWHGHRRRVANR